MLEELEKQASEELESALLDEEEQEAADGTYKVTEQLPEQEQGLDTDAAFKLVAHPEMGLLVDELLRQEIDRLQTRIQKYYHFTLFDLLGNVPVGREAQEACRCAGVCIAQTHIFLKEVRRTGNLPVNTLSEVLKIPAATLECNRMYILVLAESCAGTELSGLLLPEEQPTTEAGEALVVEVRAQYAAVLIEGGRLERVYARGLSVGAWTAAPLLSGKHFRVGAGLVWALGAALVAFCFWFLLARRS